jgi:hypothetical protein
VEGGRVGKYFFFVLSGVAGDVREGSPRRADGRRFGTLLRF